MTGEYIKAVGVDYFLDNPPLKPKSEVADYVEACGILVPKRYANLKEALASNKPFIIRSEHPQDYAGASGVLESIDIGKDKIEEALKREKSEFEKDNYFYLHDKILENIDQIPQHEIERMIIELSNREINEYARLKKITPTEFKSQISFSYWEKIDGMEQVIVADSAIKDRYHIFSHHNNRPGKRHYYKYGMYQNQRELITESFGKSEDLPLNPNKLIQIYEKVRKLPKFERDNVPVIETIYKNGEIYFLQYLRGRKFTPASFVLSRSTEPGEVEVGWVRGITPSSGIICDTRFWYEDAGLKDEITKEDASFDFHWNIIFSELMTPNRKAQLNVAMDFNHLVLKSIDMHLQKSKLFRSDTSLFLNYEQMEILFPEFKNHDSQTGKKNLNQLQVEQFHDFRAKLYILSDGYRAIIKRIS